jgi:transcriptional regulator with GAF, ATPase, and Fis domain
MVHALGVSFRKGALILWNQPGTRRHALVVAAALLVFGYALCVLGYVLLTPEIGVRCAFTPVINHFYPEFLFPDDQEPPQPGDTIIQIGDRPIVTWGQFLRTMVAIGNQDGVPVEPRQLLPSAPEMNGIHMAVLPDGQKVVQLQFRREGEATNRSVWCRLGQPPLETLVPSILWFCLKIGLFVVGAIVFWQRQDDRSAAQFFLFCIVSLGAYIGGYHWAQIATQPILLGIFMICSLFLPAVSLHFYLLFPRPKQFGRSLKARWVGLALYGPPLFFLLLLLSGYLRVRWLYDGGEPTRAGLLLMEILVEIYVYFGIAAGYYLLSLVSLVHSYCTTVDVTERNQVKWVLYGCGLALVPICYTMYLAFLDKGRFVSGAATWPMFAASLCVTVAFTISITRYRLMQLDKLISSGMVYFLVSSLAGVVYYGLVFTGMLLLGRRANELGSWTAGPSVWQALTVSSAALVVLLALDLVRNRLKTVLDRHFRHEKYQLDRTLRRMRDAIEQLVDPPALARRLLHTSADLLGASRGSVYLRQGEPPLYQLADTLGPTPPLVELSSGCPLVEYLQTQGSLWVNSRFALPGAPARAAPAQRQLHFLTGEAATPLVHEGQLLGILVLGPKETGSYTAEEFTLLGAFAQLTVLALVSAEGHRTIQTLNRDLQVKVEKIAEQQRRILVLQSQLLSSTNKIEERAARSDKILGRPDAAQFDPRSLPPADGLVGSSTRIQELRHLVRKVAGSQSAVLLRGESGTGKEILARVLHENSPRSGRAFVKVHCAALSSGVLESELFGHVKGAFTNAIRDKVGRFEAAHGGTLFLDEIGDISLDVQTKLLRVLQEMTFERVGSSEPVQVDVRVIAATHQDLEQLMRLGRFREDLFYRLNVFPIQVPPLREHIEDIPELAVHFLRVYAQRSAKELAGIDDDALALLKGFSWPGNVRQLENVIERAVVITEGTTVTTRDLPDELAEAGQNDELAAEMSAASDGETWPPSSTADGETNAAPVSAMLRAERERKEREQLVRALAAAGGNKAEAARALGMARSTLLSRLKRLGLS